MKTKTETCMTWGGIIIFILGVIMFLELIVFEMIPKYVINWGFFLNVFVRFLSGYIWLIPLGYFLFRKKKI